MDWDVRKPKVLEMEVNNWLGMDERVFLTKERAIVLCYCKSFYNSFCRLPTVPYTLSPEDIQVASKATA